jgi:hypothetical protein
MRASNNGNVHDRGFLVLSESNVLFADLQNEADLKNQRLYFCSDEKPAQWICPDFKTPQDRANTLHRADLLFWLELVPSEELGSRRLG